MHKVAFFPGDGIGPEITDAALRVVAATGAEVDWIRLPSGDESRKRLGTPMPDETLIRFVEIGVGFKGPFSVAMEDPVIVPEWRRDPASGRRPRSYNSATNALRGEAGGFAAVRLAKSFPGVPAPGPGLDAFIVREISEDIYIANEYTTQNGAAVALKVITREGSERVIRFAFEFARQHARKKVTVPNKANVLKQTDGLFVRTAREIAGEFPDIELEEMYIDAACARLVERPQSFDVAVMPNQYGDIMSDLASAVAGSVGVGGGATFGRQANLFEPVHGTAPDIAGRGIANPVSQILTAALLLRHLGETERGEAIEKAVADVLSDPRNHTPDLKGRATTKQMTDAILAALAIHLT